MRPILFTPVHPAHPMFEVVLPLCARDNDGGFFASGSAVFVAPGIAVTALHVIKDYSDRLDGVTLNASIAAEEVSFRYSVFARQMVDGSPIIWRAISMTAADPLDIAILHLERADNTPPNTSWPVPTIQFKPPAIDSDVFAVGFPKQSVIEYAPGKLKWDAEAFLAVGAVDEIHLQYRDTSRLKFPCFRTNARFDGGMSGGPVVTQGGEICGVICSNMEFYHSGEEHISYVSLLWPTLGLRIPTPAFLPSTQDNYTLRSLFELGHVSSEDWQQVRVIDERTVAIGASGHNTGA